MKAYTLEVCVDSVESAIAAQNGGATRLELCSNLVIGGTTPSLAMYKIVRKYIDIPINVLLRPRFGDFLYSEYEFNCLRKEVEMFREQEADGMVVGCLNPDGSLNVRQMELLIAEGGGMRVTLHRAFDMCRNPFDTLEAAKALGIDTILTSGQKRCCLDGMQLIGELITSAEGRIDIMAGGGINGFVIERILNEIHGCYSFHMSGKQVVNSSMIYRKDDLSMGLAGMDEYTIWRTQEDAVHQARKVLNQIGAI